MAYQNIDLAVAYRLIGHGPLVWVSTRLPNGRYNLAPIAWNCPISKSPPRLLLGIGQRHATYQAITAQSDLVVAVPVLKQAALVKQTGAISAVDQDKFQTLSIPAKKAQHIDALIPDDCLGYFECQVKDIINQASLALICADVISAGADPNGFDGQRVLVEKPEGGTLHHLGDKIFAVPSLLQGDV